MPLPTHSQMTLPLLSVLHENNGMHAKDAAQAVAEKMGLGPEITEATTELSNGRVIDVYGRRVRWLRQTLVVEGLISGEKHNWWTLTESGRAALVNARPGVILTVYETDRDVALFCEAETAVAYVRDESVQLILTSPPFPLTKPKAYGTALGMSIWIGSLILRPDGKPN
jgi:restriction endonuclease Mrr